MSSGPQGAKKRVVAENGKVLIVDTVGNVYLEEETEEGETHEYLLDVSSLCHLTNRCTCAFFSSLEIAPNSPLLANAFRQVDEIPRPSIYDTLLFRLPVWAYNRSIGRLTGSPTTQDPDNQPSTETSSEDEETEKEKTLKNAIAPNQNGDARKRKTKNRKQ